MTKMGTALWRAGYGGLFKQGRVAQQVKRDGLTDAQDLIVMVLDFRAQVVRAAVDIVQRDTRARCRRHDDFIIKVQHNVIAVFSVQLR